MPFLPAENLGETTTVGALMQRLGELPSDALVIIRITRLVVADGEPQPGDVTVQGEGGKSVTLRQNPSIDCALELDDVEESEGIVYLCTGHEAIEDSVR